MKRMPGARVSVVYASGLHQRGQGVVVAFCDEPQVLVRYEDGTQEWWRRSLTQPRGRHAQPYDFSEATS